MKNVDHDTLHNNPKREMHFLPRCETQEAKKNKMVGNQSTSEIGSLPLDKSECSSNNKWKVVQGKSRSLDLEG